MRNTLVWLTGMLTLWYGSYVYQYWEYVGGPDAVYSYIATVVVICFGSLTVTRHDLAVLNTRAKGYFVLWLMAYLAYGCATYLYGKRDWIALLSLSEVAGAVILASAFVVLLRSRSELRCAELCFATLAMGGAIVNVWDFVDPVFSFVPGRAAGLYVNPTIAGNFIALAMVAGIKRVGNSARIPFVVLCGLGVIVTFSRESWIVWSTAIVLLGWQGQLYRRSRTWAVLLIALLGVGVSVGLLSGKFASVIADSPVTTYLTANTAQRIGIGGSALEGDSSEDRLRLIDRAIQRAHEKPVLGHGLGYTKRWERGTHNMYLQFLVEGGILGAALYLALMLQLWRAGFGVGRIVAMQIIISGLFTHNHLQQPAILIMMAYVVATSLYEAKSGSLAVIRATNDHRKYVPRVV